MTGSPLLALLAFALARSLLLRRSCSTQGPKLCCSRFSTSPSKCSYRGSLKPCGGGCSFELAWGLWCSLVFVLPKELLRLCGEGASYLSIIKLWVEYQWPCPLLSSCRAAIRCFTLASAECRYLYLTTNSLHFLMSWLWKKSYRSFCNSFKTPSNLLLISSA